MVASYGAEVKKELALDRSALTLQYQTRTPGGAIQVRIVRYPHWIGVLEGNGNAGHPVSARFAGADLFWPSPIELAPPEGVEAVPLFTTSEEAWSMQDNFTTNPEVPYLFEQNAAETRGRKIMSAALSGTFPSWFQGAPKPIREGSEEELPDMPAEPKPARIIVLGDTDMASAIISMTGGQRNLDFLLQAADWLGNDDDIIGIRNREARTGRLNRISDPLKKAPVMGFAQILNVAVIPLLVILAGIGIMWRRKMKAAEAENKERSHGV
jgi:ABC-type uncharacterized transport system involved in gliding motility auxiliary subunit